VIEEEEVVVRGNERRTLQGCESASPAFSFTNRTVIGWREEALTISKIAFT
jgi:hypothetical protein